MLVTACESSHSDLGGVLPPDKLEGNANVTNANIGVGLICGTMSIVIPQGTPFPCKAIKKYYNVSDK